jgi:hypothetical protein
MGICVWLGRKVNLHLTLPAARVKHRIHNSVLKLAGLGDLSPTEKAMYPAPTSESHQRRGYWYTPYEGGVAIALTVP